VNKMSDERREIALRALRAAGHDQAAELVEAIIPAAPPAPSAAPVAPGAPEVPAAAVPAAPAEELPPGILSKDELGAMTVKDSNRRYEQIAASDEYHAGRRGV
jgi:hypothetical protein